MGIRSDWTEISYEKLNKKLNQPKARIVETDDIKVASCVLKNCTEVFYCLMGKKRIKGDLKFYIFVGFGD